MSLKRHTSYNLLGAALPIAVSLVTIPFYLEAIGEARFGILAVAWLLLGFFGQFDLGLGMAASHHIAAAGETNREERARIFWSALATNSALGILGGLIILPVAWYYFGQAMIVEDAMRAEMLAAIPWLAMAVPLATITGVLGGTLQGMSQFGRLNLISASGTVLFQLLPLAAALAWSPSLTVVLPVALAARALTMLAFGTVVWRILLKGRPITLSRERIAKMLKFGGWVTAAALTLPLLITIDRFAIGAVLGAVAVSWFTVPFSLGERLMILGNAVGSALFPKLSALKRGDALGLCLRSERVLMALMLGAVVIAIFAIEPFLQLWIGRDFAAMAAPAGQVLMLGVWIEAVTAVPLNGLRGQSRPAAIAKILWLQILPHWAILYFALTQAGLVGAAAAYVLRATVTYLLFGRALGSLRKSFANAMVCAGLLTLALLIVRHTQPWSPGWLAGFVACFGLAALFGFYLLPPDLRRFVVALPGRIAVAVRFRWKRLMTAPVRRRLAKQVLVLDTQGLVLVSNNCLAGQLYEMAGLRKASPTAGLFFRGRAFAEFLAAIDGTGNGEWSRIDPERLAMDPLRRCPVMETGRNAGVVFLHYPEPKLAARKWNDRFPRMNGREKVVLVSLRDGIDAAMMMEAQQRYRHFHFTGPAPAPPADEVVLDRRILARLAVFLDGVLAQAGQPRA